MPATDRICLLSPTASQSRSRISGSPQAVEHSRPNQHGMSAEPHRAAPTRNAKPLIRLHLIGTYLSSHARTTRISPGQMLAQITYTGPTPTKRRRIAPSGRTTTATASSRPCAPHDAKGALAAFAAPLAHEKDPASSPLPNNAYRRLASDPRSDSPARVPNLERQKNSRTAA